MFEEELNMERKLKGNEKQEIALVTQLEPEFVTQTLKKFDEYKAMHRMLRGLKMDNQPLPESVKEFQQMFLLSGQGRDSKKMKYAQYKQHNTLVRNRYVKKEHDHGYFF